MYENALATSELLAAIAGSTCCVLPLALGSLGIGSTIAADLGVLAPHQTAFRLAAVTLLGAGFWLAYSRRSVLTDGAACTPRRSAGRTKAVLWLGSAILAAVLSEPIWSGWQR